MQTGRPTPLSLESNLRLSGTWSLQFLVMEPCKIMHELATCYQTVVLDVCPRSAQALFPLWPQARAAEPWCAAGAVRLEEWGQLVRREAFQLCLASRSL